MRVKFVLKFFFLCGILFFAFSSFSQEIRWLKVYNFKGSLGISYESLEEYSSDTEDGVLYDYDENFIKYVLGLDFRGYVYHPYFVDFTVSSDLILNKGNTSVFTDTQAYTDFNNRYDINFHVLKRKPLNFLIYFRNNETTYPRVYYGRYFNFFQENGVKVTSLFKYLPFVLDISHSITVSQSLLTYDRRESSNDIKLKSDILKSDSGSLIFRGSYKNYTESIQDSHYISLTSMVMWDKYFGEKKSGRLGAVVDYRNIKTFSEITTSSARVFCIKSFKYNLDASASLNYLDSENGNLRRKLASFDAELKHRLYQSLFSSARLSFQDESGDLNSVKRSIAGYDVLYTKKIPTGRLMLHFYQSYQRIDNSSDGKYTLSQFYASFDASDTITISQNGIDPSSITVLSKDGTEVYTEGIDYDLVVSDTMVVVVRLYGGKIEEGETVLVIYSLTQFPDYTMNVHNYEDSASLTLLKYFFVGGSIKKSSNSISSDYIITPYEQYVLREKNFGFKNDTFYFKRSRSRYYGDFSEYSLRSENFKVRFHIKRITAGYYYLKYKLDFFSTDYFSHFRSDAFYVSSKLLGRINVQFDWRRLKYNQNDFLRDRDSILCRINGVIRKLRVELLYEHILDNGALSDRKHDYFRISVRRIF